MSGTSPRDISFEASATPNHDYWLRKQLETLKLSLTANGMGTWEMNLVTGQRRWSVQTCALHGVKPAEIDTEGVVLTDALMHPEDRERLRALHEKLRAGLDSYEFEYRTVWGGKTHWIAARGSVLDRSAEGPTRMVGVVWDITQLKESHEAKLQAEERLRLATETAGMFAWENDLVGHKMYWAENSALIIGCPQSSLTERPEDGAFFVLPEDRPKVLQAFEAAQAEGDTYTLEFRGIDPRSERAFWRVNGKFMRGASGQVERAIGVTENITRQKRFENALRVSAERFAATEAAAGTLSYDTDIANGTVWRSGGMTRLLGWSVDEVPATAEGWTALKHPDDRLPVYNAGRDSYLSDSDHYSIEYRVAHKDGHYVWVMDSGRVFRNDSGEIIRYLGSTIDISERKRVEAGTARMAAVAAASQDALFGVDLNGRIEAWNPSAERLFGYSADEIVGQHLSLLAEDAYRAEQSDIVGQVTSGNSVGPLETKRQRKDGTSFYASLSVSPVRASDGTVTGMAATVRDISDRKEWQARQIMMSRELAHRVKNSFAILQSILRSTLRSSSSPEQFAVAFSSRVHSLSVAQDVLTDNDWKGAELGDLARRQLAPYMSRIYSRIDIQGPKVRLPADYAVPFSLIFNELASNASKHGALSNGSGTVSLSWTLAIVHGGPPRLFVRWEEHVKTVFLQPGPDAFGAKLIDKSLAEANVTREYRPEGLLCSIDVGLA